MFGGAVGGGVDQSITDFLKNGKINLKKTLVAAGLGFLITFGGGYIDSHSDDIIQKVNNFSISPVTQIFEDGTASAPKTIGDTLFGQWLQKFADGGKTAGSKQTLAVNEDPNVVNGIKKPPLTEADFNEVRKHFNIPARTGDDDKWTVAVLRMDGQEYWSKNGKWKQKASGVEPNFKDPEEYAQVRKLLGINAESAGHAEGMAFYKALQYRKQKGISGGKVVLYVDKIPCGFCRRSGIKPLMKAVGLDELDLYYLQDGKMNYVRFYRDPKNPNKILNTPYPTLKK